MMTQQEFYDTWYPEEGLVAHTSGSTGKPKEIRLPRELVERSALRTNGFFGIGQGSRLHVPLDFNYIAAKMMAIRAEMSGATLTSETPSNRPMKDMRSDEVIDLLAVVPSQMEYILDNLNNLPELRTIIIGGGVVPEAIKRRITESGLNAWETYGMTETASHIALRKVGEDWFEILEGITISQDPEGCLVIDMDCSPSICTNDMVEMMDSRRFRILGRRDNVINTGGKKVYAEELEMSLGEIWEGFEFAITSRPDVKWGERIVAVVASCGISEEELLTLARKKIEPHLVPKEIRFVSELPRTSNGKISRSQL